MSDETQTKIEHPAPEQWPRPPSALPGLQDIECAATRIGAQIPETPLVRSAALSSLLEADVWLKVETITPIASYKLRGALNHLLVAHSHGSCRSAVTSSTGNHGQGVACAAAMLGLKAVVFLPLGAVEIKKSMIRLLKADVREIGHDLDASKEHARAFAAANRATFVDDGESFEMIEGAGTIGLEIARRLDRIDRVYVPMGSGTMAAGVATAIRGMQPAAEIIAVQSEGAPAMVESFRMRRVVERPIDTIADCLVCRIPAMRAFLGIMERVSDCRLVSDNALLRSMHTLLNCVHVLVEPGAAAGLAAAWQDREQIRNRRIVIVLSGANVSAEILREALSVPPLGELQHFP